MQCLLLLLTQARQCAALHHALAASRALDNCPPIATRHRPTAPQHLHLHARGDQRRRPTCSCGGQCGSNRPAVRHVEHDAALEAVDEDPRGPRPGKTGAAGVGARPRRRRSCCSAAAPPYPRPKSPSSTPSRSRGSETTSRRWRGVLTVRARKPRPHALGRGSLDGRHGLRPRRDERRADLRRDDEGHRGRSVATT